MPDKKENLIKIKQDYNIDLLFAEGKITLEEFLKKRSLGPYERWREMRYVAANPLFLRSFLLKLPVELRLQAVRALYDYSSKYHKNLGEFGGSISEHFRYEPGILEDRKFTTQKARLAISLDIPLVYILRDNPTEIERQHYDVMEYLEIGEKVSFEELGSVLKRPSKRKISCYIIKDEIPNNNLLKSSNNNLICRVDLHKTFFVVEFYLESYVSIDIQSIQWLIAYFEKEVCKVILSTPLLRDTKKLSLIGVYIKEQQSNAIEFSDYLMNNWSGEQLFPANYEFENSVPLKGFR